MASVTSVSVWWLPENPQAFEASKFVRFFAKIRISLPRCLHFIDVPCKTYAPHLVSEVKIIQKEREIKIMKPFFMSL